MKNILLALLVCLSSLQVMAKKVKFSVDMSQQVISPNGIHVTGDFQTLAGFPGGDWASNTTPLTQEGTTTIYSIVVDIPAFAKYEYKFVNGDQFYEVEFVPVESRIGYNFNDNRWIYVDSLSNDTSTTGELLFAGNAPAGMNLLRLVVDMQNVNPVSPAGVHVFGTFQGWNPAAQVLYSFVPGIHEVIVHVNPGTYEYLFINGNDPSDAEILPAMCSVNDHREAVVQSDLVVGVVCFGECTPCTPSATAEFDDLHGVKLYPNPSSGITTLQYRDFQLAAISVFDLTGRLLQHHDHVLNHVTLDGSKFKSGTYMVKLSTINNEEKILKWLIE